MNPDALSLCSLYLNKELYMHTPLPLYEVIELEVEHIELGAEPAPTFAQRLAALNAASSH